MKSTPRETSSSKRSKSKAKRSGLHFPISKISRNLKDGKYSERVAEGAAVYLAAVLQRMAAEVLELSGKEAMSEGRSRIAPRHIELAIRNDVGLNELLSDVTIPGSGKKIQFHEDLLPKSTGERNRNIGSGSEFLG